MDNRSLARGKWVEDGQLIIGIYRIYKNKDTITTFTKEKNGEIILRAEYEIIPETLSQCTGLTAESSYRGDTETDRLMFVGDLLRMYSYDELADDITFNIGIIEQIDKIDSKHYGAFIVRMNSGYTYMLGSIMDREIEIIGTKWNNMELLEGEQ